MTEILPELFNALRAELGLPLIPPTVVSDLSMWVDDGGIVNAAGKADLVSLYAVTGQMGSDDARLTREEVVELRDWLNTWLDQTDPEIG